MKFLRPMLTIALISFSTAAFAQSNAQKSFDLTEIVSRHLAGRRNHQPEGSPAWGTMRMCKSRCA